jgi:hypothetical protein
VSGNSACLLKCEVKSFKGEGRNEFIILWGQTSFMQLLERWGHTVAQWFNHCATNRKIAGSIPDGVIGIFH